MLTVAKSPRRAHSADDWGDSKTVGLHVRRLVNGETIPIAEATHGDFGQYLGQHGGKHVICMLTILFDIHGVAEYVTAEEMKKEWCLD